MKCLRCGYCCRACCVTIVDDPEKGVALDNLIFHSGTDGPCKHLRGEEPGKHSCAIHDRPWYPKTRCFSHGQIERSPDEPCRTGVWMMEQWREEGLVFPIIRKS